MTPRVAKWDVFEVRLPAGSAGEAWFVGEGARRYAAAFETDGDDVVRFMPDTEGTWTYTITAPDAGAPLAEGGFECGPPEPGVHGVVRVRDEFGFEHADGRRFLPFGIQPDPDVDVSTLPGFADAPFTKVRLSVTPRRLDAVEEQVRRLRILGVQADLLLDSDVDDSPRFIRNAVSRLAAFHNVWWSLRAAGPDGCPGPEWKEHVEAVAATVREFDAGGHLLSVHGDGDADFGPVWVTHASVRTEDVRRISALRAEWDKPVIVDDCGAVGHGAGGSVDMPCQATSTALSPEEGLLRIAEGLCRGGYVGFRGELDSPTVPRIGFLRELLDPAPMPLTYNSADHYASMIHAPGAFALQYLGPHRFPRRRFDMPDGRHRVEVVDTWAMTVEELPGRYSGEFSVPLPGTLHQAIRTRRASPWCLWDQAGASRLELDPEPDGGRWDLGLWRVGADEPSLTVDLRALVVFSTGRPWAITHPEFVEHRVRLDGASLVVDLRTMEGDVELRIGFVDGHVELRAVFSGRRGDDRTRTDVVAGLAIEVPAMTPDRVVLPGVLYHGNRGSDRSDVVARAEDGVVVERHRLPIPAVNVEWDTGASHPAAGYLTVFAGADVDSLGVVGDRIVLLTGPTMLNGVVDRRAVHKSRAAERDDGYRTLGPGGSLRLSCRLDVGEVSAVGEGYRALVRSAGVHRERAARPLTLDQIIDAKAAVLDSRWIEDASSVAGYLKFDRTFESSAPGRRNVFMYGWTGQGLKLAWCDAAYRLIGGRDVGPGPSRVDRVDRVDRCRRAVDFYLAGSGTGRPGLRLPIYRVGDKAWEAFDTAGGPLISSRALGETICDLAAIIELFTAHGEPVPASWPDALAEAAAFLADSPRVDGLVPIGWRPDGTPSAANPAAAGLPVVEALVRAGRVEPAAALFAAYHGVPFARSTLDAACVDKESGIAMLRSALALYDATGEPTYRATAESVADWLETWVYVWNPPYPAGSRFDEREFSAVGWSTVSVQNHHLDVFFPYYEFFRLGRRSTAEAMVHAVGQGICTEPGEWGFDQVGEQPEGFFQTDWQARGEANTWNPAWVISQVMSNALLIRRVEWRGEEGRCM